MLKVVIDCISLKEVGGFSYLSNLTLDGNLDSTQSRCKCIVLGLICVEPNPAWMTLVDLKKFHRLDLAGLWAGLGLKSWPRED